jgi:hypothetical protein
MGGSPCSRRAWRSPRPAEARVGRVVVGWLLVIARIALAVAQAAETPLS